MGALCEANHHLRKAIGSVWIEPGGQGEVVVELSQVGAKGSRHLELEIQPTLELPRPMQRARGEVFGHDRDVQIPQDARQGGVPMQVILHREREEPEVAIGAGSVAFFVVLVGSFREGEAWGGRSGDGIGGRDQTGEEGRRRPPSRGGEGGSGAGRRVYGFVHGSVYIKVPGAGGNGVATVRDRAVAQSARSEGILGPGEARPSERARWWCRNERLRGCCQS